MQILSSSWEIKCHKIPLRAFVYGLMYQTVHYRYIILICGSNPRQTVISKDARIYVETGKLPIQNIYFHRRVVVVTEMNVDRRVHGINALKDNDRMADKKLHY